MENFYTDNEDLRFHLDHPMMKKIVSLKERNYEITEEEYYDNDGLNPDDFKPHNYEDAIDNYNEILNIVGEICGEIVAPNAEGVDEEGPLLMDNKVYYAKGTIENMKALKQARLTGMTLPRKYGGLNFPSTAYSMAVEMVSRADASLMNLFGLQDIGETINEFADEETKQGFLHRFASGTATGAMILTEPDAGSDLQSVNLKASFDEATNTWRLNGVKRFITNGNAELSLVLARSEEGTKDGRGLSMFLYDRDDTVQIRRIENKMGIHGSPTCEMVFKNSPCILIGRRKFGLIKYVMALMNGARLGIGAQSIGIAEAAFREALKYAKERMQFGKTIDHFPGVYEMLSNMKIKIAASRSLLYETSRFVDLYKAYEELSQERKLSPEETQLMKKYKKQADYYTPLLKGLTSEFCNSIAYDAIQIYGGAGFMKDFAVERLYRDARITSIYEGTTQLQVVAAIKGVTSGLFTDIIEEYQSNEVSADLKPLQQSLEAMKDEYVEAIALAKNSGDNELLEFHSRRLVEMVGNIIMGHLLVLDANRNDKYKTTAELFIKKSQAENTEKCNEIKTLNSEELELYKTLAV